MRTKNLVMLLVTVLAFCFKNCAAEHKSTEDDSNGALINVEGSHENMITPENSDAVTEKFLTDSSKVFVPTDEWQKLDPDQVVPRGSHVRLNLETGEREAKLLEKDGNSKDTIQQTADAPSRMERLRTAIEEAMKELEANKDGTDADEVLPDDLQYWKHADKEGIVNLKNRHFTKDELKQALKKFKASRDDVVDKRPDADKKFRTIDEIREDFKNLNMDMKTDLELLTETLEQYRRPGLEVDERLAILADLEYYLHQIDNAKNFADMGGLALIVTDLNSTVEEVRKAAALAVSSAVQSNPSVQVVAIESGAMQQLIRMLSTDPSVAVRTRSLGTLSSLVRHFPYAQRKFLELGGLQALSDLLAQYGTISGLEKVSVKAVTLVNDLLTEKAAVMADSSNNDEVHEQRRRQYSQVPLLDSVVENGWCRMVPRLLELSEHDSREKVIGLMWTLSKHCKNDFARYLTLLEHLKLEYTQLSGSESVDQASDDSDSSVSYFSDLLRTIDDVISHVSDGQVRKVEL